MGCAVIISVLAFTVSCITIYVLPISFHSAHCFAQESALKAQKQARLGREEVDVVSTSLPAPSTGMSHLDVQIRASIAAAAPHSAEQTADTEAADQVHAGESSARSCAEQQQDMRAGGNSQLQVHTDQQRLPDKSPLTSFLGNYDSESGDESGSAT